MRAVLQRVSRAQVSVDGQITGSIGRGLLVLLGVGREDSEAQADYLLDKILNLRVFPDETGRMNASLLDLPDGQLLIVSQFTLYGDCRKGRRPSYTEAATSEQAEKLYNYFVECARATGLKVGTGVFQAMMAVELVNDGPVTLLLDTARR